MRVDADPGSALGLEAQSAQGRVIWSGVAVMIVVVLGLAAAQVIDFGLHLHTQALNSQFHASIFGVASLVAQGFAAVAAALRSRRSARSGAWLFLCGLILALLVPRVWIPDQVVRLLPALAAVFVLVWWLSTGDPRRVRRVIACALALLVMSFLLHALGMRLLPALGYGRDGWAYQVEGILKHGTELAGWLLLATGIAAGGRAPRPIGS